MLVIWKEHIDMMFGIKDDYTYVLYEKSQISVHYNYMRILKYIKKEKVE